MSNKTKNNTEMNSASLLISVCHDDYIRQQNVYDKINDKANILLGFQGIMIPVLLNEMDFHFIYTVTHNSQLDEETVSLAQFSEYLFVAGMAIFIYVFVYTLHTMKGRRIDGFESESIIMNEIYNYPEEKAALWIMEKYGKECSKLRKICKNKQEHLDELITWTARGIVLVIIALFFKKTIMIYL